MLKTDHQQGKLLALLLSITTTNEVRISGDT
jgi:hypothetical protein